MNVTVFKLTEISHIYERSSVIIRDGTISTIPRPILPSRAILLLPPGQFLLSPNQFYHPGAILLPQYNFYRPQAYFYCPRPTFFFFTTSGPIYTAHRTISTIPGIIFYHSWANIYHPKPVFNHSQAYFYGPRPNFTMSLGQFYHSRRIFTTRRPSPGLFLLLPGQFLSTPGQIFTASGTICTVPGPMFPSLGLQDTISFRLCNTVPPIAPFWH